MPHELKEGYMGIYDGCMKLLVARFLNCSINNKFIISRKTYSLIVIPACLWQESNIYKDMDARQKPSGMTKNRLTYKLLSNINNQAGFLPLSRFCSGRNVCKSLSSLHRCGQVIPE